jgi:hypothetical protein
MGMPLPEAYANKPTLLTGLEFYWKAFWELSSDRSLGMAEGPIPWSSLDRYAVRYDIFDEEFYRFSSIIRTMDSEYMKFRSKTSQSKSKVKSKNRPMKAK